MASNLIQVADLQTNYLSGINLVDQNGNALPNAVFQNAIDASVDWFTTTTHLWVEAHPIVDEVHDYRVDEYFDYCYLKLFEYPILSVQSVSAIYPTGQTILQFPNSWIKIMSNAGQIQLVPTAGTLSQILLGQGGSYLPLLDGRLSYLPSLFHVSYTAGFATGSTPALVNQVIAMRAAMSLLGMLSTSVLGQPGVGTQSVSMDGISQSVGLANGIMGPFSPLYRIYKEMVEQGINDLKDRYQGIRFTV